MFLTSNYIHSIMAGVRNGTFYTVILDGDVRCSYAAEQNGRSYMDDVAGVFHRDESICAIVCDGHNGDEASTLCANEFGPSLLKYLSQPFGDISNVWEAVVKKMFADFDNEVSVNVSSKLTLFVLDIFEECFRISILRLNSGFLCRHQNTCLFGQLW